jgi:Mlc titration factor MtfA (ptsG expression regulator)
MFGLFRTRRREELRRKPFPPGWAAILERNVPLYGRLPGPDREQLHGLIHVFLDEKHFEGCGGLELTDEIRVTIAAQACLLLLGRAEESDDFRRLVTILVYPGAYVAHGVEAIGGGMVLEGDSARLGEASPSGVVVLSWDDVLRGAADPRDGQNVVLHEFAHQLDQEDGASDGTPRLGRRSRYVAWARVLGEEYDRLRAGKASALDAYGGVNPAEFFAVATECFFERPATLRRRHPELFAELAEYYRLDPARWLDAGGGTPP